MKHKSSLRLFAFVVMIMMVGLACQALGSNPTQAPATNPPVTNPPVENTPVPQNQPTSAPTEPPVQTSNDKYFTEDFNGTLSNWSKQIELNSKDGDTSQAHVDVKDGYLVFDLGKNLISYMFYDGSQYDNVRIDARVDNRGINVNDVLLVCRASEEGHYLVNIANSGLFSIYAYDGAKKTYTRIADGGSNKIKSGKDINDYALVCNDRTLILYINGFETRRYTDNQFVFRNGKVAVGVASEDQIPVKVEFDWVKISQP